jgi:quinolinate synthase
MNSLQSLEQVLLRQDQEIHIEEALRVRAVIPIQRMLDFAHAQAPGSGTRGAAR